MYSGFFLCGGFSSLPDPDPLLLNSVDETGLGYILAINALSPSDKFKILSALVGGQAEAPIMNGAGK